MDIEQAAQKVIENGYANIEEGDELITITERGLKEAILFALRRVRSKAYEDAIAILKKHSIYNGNLTDAAELITDRLNELERQ